MRGHELLRMLSALLFAALGATGMVGAGCDSAGGVGGGSSTSCLGFNGSTVPFPEGAYLCEGSDSIVTCSNGQWVDVVECSTFSWRNDSGFTYPCHCSGGDGVPTTGCGYAGHVCGGVQYPTCPSGTVPKPQCGTCTYGQPNCSI
jgi:hypothetical protein